ncbi:PCC domain-containing protein [Sphingomonas adhaesiva]|uniref:PCC domain-containing protein n=1 Tax=Sphingomonas adhaesiva TaxID=28212 RepID=UPI002FFC3915
MRGARTSKLRTVLHPGAPLDARARSVAVETSPTIGMTVPAGRDLFDAVHERLDMLGAPGGSFVLTRGSVDRLSLMTGGAGSDGLPMGFHGPHALAAPLRIVAGAAGSGIDEAGARFTHCHAAFRDRDGRLVGGHLIPGETIAGADGIELDLVALVHGRFRRQVDPETRFSIFHPEPA